MKIKARLMDRAAIERSLKRMAHEIVERDPEESKYIVLGIKRRGVPLAKILENNLKEISNVEVQGGYLDISLYRDDLTEIGDQAKVSDRGISDLKCKNRSVIIVDDVIYTGRTARAAMEAVISMGRPKVIRLACLIDRGHREMPIRPDFVGKNVPTSRNEIIKVELPEYDYNCQVLLMERD